MYLKHKDYTEPSKTARVIPDVKAAIKTYVGNGKKSYEDIVKEIQKTNPIMTNDDVITQIKQVATETDYLVKPEVEI
jgi:hypothetical protein